LPSDEVVTVVAEEIPEAEVTIETVKAEDYGFESEVKEEKKPKKAQAEPGPEPEKEIKTKPEPRTVTSAEDFDWDTLRVRNYETHLSILSMNPSMTKLSQQLP